MTKEEKAEAFANNPYSIGDIITDGLKTIRIQSIFPMKYAKQVMCLYVGEVLNKQLKPIKNRCPQEIIQINVR